MELKLSFKLIFYNANNNLQFFFCFSCFLQANYLQFSLSFHQFCRVFNETAFPVEGKFNLKFSAEFELNYKIEMKCNFANFVI